MAWYGIRRKSKRWQRETIVAGTLWASVVARTNIACGGGSSSVLRNASQAAGGELVRLVDDVDAIATFAGSVRDLVAQVANIVDAAVGRRVDLDQVQRAAVERRQTQRAGVARIAVLGVLAVDGAVQDASDARLARAARPGEQVRVRWAAGLDRIAQGARDVLLADDVLEARGAASAGTARDAAALGRDWWRRECRRTSDLGRRLV